MRIVKHRLHPGMNKFANPGKLKLQHMDYQDTKLYGWFTEITLDYQDEYEVYVALTGEQIPDDYNYVCTAQLDQAGGHFVVHGFD